MKFTKSAKFKENELVRVRSKEEIITSVDAHDKLCSNLFVDQILDYCGNVFKVQKIVYNYFDEHKFRMFRVIEPLYFLDGLICNGEGEKFECRCDRSCYLLWHEKWLEKV